MDDMTFKIVNDTVKDQAKQIASLQAKLKQEHKCSEQLQDKCDNLRADKLDLQAKMESLEAAVVGEKPSTALTIQPFLAKIAEQARVIEEATALIRRLTGTTNTDLGVAVQEGRIFLKAKAKEETT